ncbi:Uncharacterized protein QTN25_009909 [Entamoeba marina]
MRNVAFIVIVFAVAVSAQSSGFWMPTLYKIQERIGEIAIRLDEVEDEQRHVMDMIDENMRDLKFAVTKNEKYVIGRKIDKLRAKLVSYHIKKLALLRALKKSIHSVPHEYRSKFIRKMRLERRFASIKEITNEIHHIMKPVKHVRHKKSTKAALKRMGHGIAKKVKKSK